MDAVRTQNEHHFSSSRKFEEAQLCMNLSSISSTMVDPASKLSQGYGVGEEKGLARRLTMV